MKPALFVVLAALAGAALAQDSPSEVTDGEIARYKALAQKGCREPVLARSDPQERIDKFCNCIMSVLEKSLTRTEWQQLSFYSMKNRAADEKLVLEPHLKKFEACRMD